MTSTSAGWVKFFKDAGLPPDLSAKYAVMFTDHRIQKHMVGDLDRDILSDIGVVPVGDKMAILKQARFTAEQAKRDQSSKLLADGVKTLESRPNKGSSPAARMITHGINGRDYSASGRSSPQSASDEDSSKKSVFHRLGNDSPTGSPAKTPGVFSRLGKESQGKELPYAGVLKKTPNEGTPTKKTLVTQKAKSTSVLDRLGAPKEEDLPDSSTQTKKLHVTGKLRIKKSVMEAKKLVEGTPKTELNSGVTENKPVVLKLNTKKVSVHDRLGDIVTSTTAQVQAGADGTGMDVKTARKRKLIIKVPKKNTKIMLKRKSTGDMETVVRKKPISSNTVSSTSSAGIFKRESTSTSNVFSRLGKKTDF